MLIQKKKPFSIKILFYVLSVKTQVNIPWCVIHPFFLIIAKMVEFFPLMPVYCTIRLTLKDVKL